MIVIFPAFLIYPLCKTKKRAPSFIALLHTLGTRAPVSEAWHKGDLEERVICLIERQRVENKNEDRSGSFPRCLSAVEMFYMFSPCSTY